MRDAGGRSARSVSGRAQKYRREHLEQYAQHDKARANQPQRVEARRKYYEEHKQEISEYKKKWAENKDSVDASRREHYELNRDDVITRRKKRAEEAPRR